MAKVKSFKPKARLPRGFVDRPASDVRAGEAMAAIIGEVFERYGFDPVETPLLEYADALGKFLPDEDRPNAGVFSLTDDDDQWMSLRYDLTAPLARHVAQNLATLPLPYRSYRRGYVFRNEKPGPGRFRQFMQFDADTVGAPSVTADAEMCMMMADTMQALGIERGDYVIRVNNRKFLDALMMAAGLGGAGQTATRLTVLRSLDKADKVGLEGVQQLLGSGRQDESGDFTKGAGLGGDQIEMLLAPFKIDAGLSGARRLDALEDLLKSHQAPLTGIDELRQIGALVAAADYGEDQVKIDPSCVRGLDYYTGPVYEAELTFPVANEKGQTVRFGSVGGGGRYDGLIARFTGQPVPATGISIGVSRLMTALANLGKFTGAEVAAPVVVCVMDRDLDSLVCCQRFTQTLRNAGIRAEMFQGNPKNFGKQLQYADRRNAPCAIIQGSDERARRVVQIKDLDEGKRLAGEITDNEAWRQARAAQVEVAEADLVAEVRRVLARRQTAG